MCLKPLASKDQSAAEGRSTSSGDQRVVAKREITFLITLRSVCCSKSNLRIDGDRTRTWVDLSRHVVVQLNSSCNMRLPPRRFFDKDYRLSRHRLEFFAHLRRTPNPAIRVRFA